MIAAYVAAVAAVPSAPQGRMLYDDLVPQPRYRWAPAGSQEDLAHSDTLGVFITSSP